MSKPLNYHEMGFTPKEAEEILARLYGLKGQAVKLPGEKDFNFKIEINDQASYILKISRPDSPINELDFQQKMLMYLEQKDASLVVPRVVKDLHGDLISGILDGRQKERKVRLLSWIPGRIYGQVHPHSHHLRQTLGIKLGRLTKALEGFDHEMARRDFEWDVAQSIWTQEHLELFAGEDRELISFFQKKFLDGKITYDRLRRSVVHNDGNDNNLVVTDSTDKPEVLAAIDYGDAIYTQIINDLAIACAYGIMGQNEPLSAALSIVSGYHKSYPLLEEELEHLYTAVAMRLVISITKAALNKIKEPDNAYLQISERPAWELLKKWRQISPDFAHFRFRQACGLNPHPNEEEFKKWAQQQQCSIQNLFPTSNSTDCALVDLSLSSPWLGHYTALEDESRFGFKFEQLQKAHPGKILAGGYLEARMIYNTDAYERLGENGPENRTIHLGIDYWQKAQTAVHAFIDGEVVMAVNDEGEKEYGGLLILKHQTENFEFYSLYGHLSVQSVEKHQVGDPIAKGELIALLGEFHENGNWPPHLHFQLMLSLLDYQNDFPGVAYQSEIETWTSLCPDPNLIFKNKALIEDRSISNEALIAYRKDHLGKSLSLSYKEPLQMVRGMGVYLIDQFGRKYLDTVNNVAHVGHEHPAVVKAGQEQMALLNTNSRYLHQNINLLAEELLATLPEELSVVHFVNSGSEANELAIRMAKTITGEKDFIASEMGYHGNSNACIDISSYKFEAQGGAGCPEHTHIFPLPDRFRGKFRGEDCGTAYASEVDKILKQIKDKGRAPAALIVEPIISCGGQIELPDGFLKAVYESVRAEGGLCISDEVQVGCGRLGKAFWGFQLHRVIPDIVTIGKPLGNGHPVAAVVCTQKVADGFANGMEYFNTFGGNPVSSAIARSVLLTIKNENLQQNCLEVGEYLKNELTSLSKEFPIFADIRGQGLFLGIELTDSERNPMMAQAEYLSNRMKENGILMSTDGPDHNVLKIKPPIVFNKANARELIQNLQLILREDFMKL